MKKIFATILAAAFAVSAIGCSAVTPISGGGKANGGQTSTEEVMPNMPKVKEQYEDMLAHPEKFPVNFVYDNVYYSGFGSKYFKETSRTRVDDDDKTTVDIEFTLTSTLKILLKTAYYPNYDAYDYTVYFENDGKTNSGVLEKLNAVDMNINGKDAVLKGIGGDHSSQYAPYEYDLKEQDVNFTSVLGRSCHEYFPYFNLEHDGGGALFAIGWAGTWQADFKYDSMSESTRFTGAGTVGLKTYLKPGEKVRTPLIAAVFYDERDEEKAMNKWRQWVIDYNMPRENAQTDEPVKPSTSACFDGDTGLPSSDGSISECSTTWKKTYDAIIRHNMDINFRWFDAGWYGKPNGAQNTELDWWGSVGTWQLDKYKWPNNTFRESVDYGHDNGIKTLVWFEPDRVTYLDDMVKRHGYKREWVITDDAKTYLNNIGIPECLDWTVDRIISMMEENDVDLYREDYNFDAGRFWDVGDGYQGANRKGISENLNIQGHYELFDRIINWGAENGKCTYVDSCASGGGRNDLETLRRSVPLLRSDSDRTTITLRLAMTTRLTRWIPYSGCVAKESASQLEVGSSDMYIYRGSYVQHMTYSQRWSLDESKINWDMLTQAQTEWNEVKQYFYNDFYVLTPFRSVTDSSNWTAYMYFDGDKDSGVLQAFRLPDCKDSTYKVNVKGVKPDNYYTLRDLDGVNSATHVKGSDLINGYTLSAENPRTAIVMFIDSENRD